jgi:hypothetical protein
MHASASMKRFVVQRKSLFGIVAGISVVVLAFLLAWTLVDPPQRQVIYMLTKSTSVNNETEIDQQFFCASEYSFWTYISLTWITFLLVCATVLAVQTRGVRQEFNESQILALMIYSHSVFVLLRVVCVVFLPAALDEPTLALGGSIILSVDTLATLAIYFLPKFLTTDVAHRRNSLQGGSRTSWMLTDSDIHRLYEQKGHMENESNSMSACIEFGPAPDDGDETSIPDHHLSREGLRQRKQCSRCGSMDWTPVQGVDVSVPVILPTRVSPSFSVDSSSYDDSSPELEKVDESPGVSDTKVGRM